MARAKSGGKSAVRTLLGSSWIGFNVAVARRVGLNGAVLLHELARWSDHPKSEDGWIYRTQGELEEATTLSDFQQQKARKTLVGAGVLEEKRRGRPARLYYRVQWGAIEALLTDSSSPESGNQDSEKVGIKIPTNSETSFRESGEHYIRTKKEQLKEETPHSPQPSAGRVIPFTGGSTTQVPGDTEDPIPPAPESQDTPVTLGPFAEPKISGPYHIWSLYCDTRGIDKAAIEKKPRNQQIAQCKALADYDDADIVGCTRYLMSQEWRNTTWGPPAVTRELPGWIAAGRPAREPKRGERDEPETGSFL